MLREIRKTSRKPGEPRKRWFSSAEMDLFVWFNDSDEIVSYQLAYDKLHSEKVLTWKQGKGFDHLGVDDGVRPGKHPASPLLVKDAAVTPSQILSLLKQNVGGLDPAIANFIVAGIEESIR